MWVSYFGLWVAGSRHFPCCVSWVPLSFQKVLGAPFSSKSHSFSRFTVFMLRASLLTPNVCSFYFSGCLWHPSDVTVLKRHWFRDAATTKNWVPSRSLSFAPLPNLPDTKVRAAKDHGKKLLKSQTSRVLHL